MGFKIAVAGATGNVGREMLNILEERGFPADEVVALASRRSVGTEVSYGDKTLKVKDLETYDFSGVDLVLMSAGGKVSKEWSPKIAAQGAVVIDNTSQFRYDPEIPLNVVDLGLIYNVQVNPDSVDPSANPAICGHRDVNDRARMVADTVQIRSGFMTSDGSVAGPENGRPH